MLHQRLGVLDDVGDRDFDQHVLAGAHHLLALAEVHLRRRGEDHRVGALDALRQIAGVVRDAVFLRHLRGGVLIAADQRGDLGVGNALERVEMFLAERALPGDANLHYRPLITVGFACAAARRAGVLAALADLALRAAARFRAAGRRPAPRGLFSRMMWPTAVFEAGTV